MNIKRILIVVILQFAACTIPENRLNYDKLQDHFFEQGIDISTKKSILVLDDEGCINCNRSFSNLIQSYLDREDVVVVNQADGKLIDISKYLSNNKVINDYNNVFAKEFQLNSSVAVFLQDHLVDTIVPIKAKTLVQDINFISKRLAH